MSTETHSEIVETFLVAYDKNNSKNIRSKRFKWKRIEAIKKNLNFLKKIKRSSSKTKLILFLIEF